MRNITLVMKLLCPGHAVGALSRWAICYWRVFQNYEARHQVRQEPLEGLVPRWLVGPGRAFQHIKSSHPAGAVEKGGRRSEGLILSVLFKNLKKVIISGRRLRRWWSQGWMTGLGRAFQQFWASHHVRQAISKLVAAGGWPFFTLVSGRLGAFETGSGWLGWLICLGRAVQRAEASHQVRQAPSERGFAGPSDHARHR